VERRRIPSGSPYEPIVGFSRALVAGTHVFGEVRPANGIIVVHGFVDPRWLVEVEAQAVLA